MGDEKAGAAAFGMALAESPSARRTLDRRWVEIAAHAEEQIRRLGLLLSGEMVTDGGQRWIGL